VPRPTLPIVVTIIWGILAVPGLLGAALSPMFFDAPGSMNNPAAWINAAIVVSFPCLCIISIVASWLVWRWHRRAATRSWSYAQIAAACLPLLPIGYFAAVLAIGTIGLLMSGQPMGLHSTVIKP
jgi:hypothetical protein